MESIVALMSFAFVMSITPGPNNVLLMSSGLRFGVKRTLPHMAGIQFGLAMQLVMCAYGLGLFITENPVLLNVMRVVGTMYLCYLAWQLRKLEIKDRASEQKPFTFLQAAAFQFINPKAWLMSITAGALLLPAFETQWLSIAMLCVIFCSVGAPSSGSWAVFGSLLREYLKNRTALQVFNVTLIGLTLFTAYSFWS
ncbi:Cysteine/O-acetylserine efflux protein [Thalassocella blandensis]|nr:Cysteine/O-acetylserine efflux protein [Thalassocella blandensis]